jgi:Skp family chaperone for outer membrane proteins
MKSPNLKPTTNPKKAKLKMSRIAHLWSTTKTLTLLLGVAVLLAFAPAAPAAAAGGLAIIDLDRVATAMGWLDDLNKNLQAADTELRFQLEQAWRASVKAIEDAKADVSADAKLSRDQMKVLNSIQDMRDLAQLPLSAGQRDKLTTALTTANTRWQTAQNNYQQQLQQRRSSLILNYRDKIRPFARRAAVARGLEVVVTTSDNLLSFEPAADITNDVIDEMQKAGMQKIAAPAPAATTPATPDKTGSK